MHSKEGVTQGDPLVMIAYGIGVLPLIRVLQVDHPQVYQPWYADDAGAWGRFQDIMAHFRDLQLKGPARGYFSNPTKSILVVSEKNVPRAKAYFRGMGIKVVTGSRYLGGYIGELETEAQWVKEKVEGWSDSVRTLSGVAHKHPQSAYAGLQKSLQQEWAFAQRVTPGISNAFGPVEEETAKAFLPALFEGVGDGAPGREITRLPVEQAGMTLPDPTQTAPENWQASCVITGHLVSALRGQVPFRTADHAA